IQEPTTTPKASSRPRTGLFSLLVFSLVPFFPFNPRSRRLPRIRLPLASPARLLGALVAAGAPLRRPDPCVRRDAAADGEREACWPRPARHLLRAWRRRPGAARGVFAVRRWWTVRRQGCCSAAAAGRASSAGRCSAAVRGCATRCNGWVQGSDAPSGSLWHSAAIPGSLCSRGTASRPCSPRRRLSPPSPLRHRRLSRPSPLRHRRLSRPSPLRHRLRVPSQLDHLLRALLPLHQHPFALHHPFHSHNLPRVALYLHLHMLDLRHQYSRSHRPCKVITLVPRLQTLSSRCRGQGFNNRCRQCRHPQWVHLPPLVIRQGIQLLGLRLGVHFRA
ncbi:hypothetical protein EJB05_47059, partial [Eragrostis curvula]